MQTHQKAEHPYQLNSLCLNMMNLVGEQGAESGGVLHDQRCDRQKWQEEHVHLRMEKIKGILS